MLKMNNLKKCFDGAKVKNKRFVGVVIGMDGFPKPEVIINEASNFDSKLAYYQKTYDEDLNHKFADGIKIIGFAFGDSFQEIAFDLFGE